MYSDSGITIRKVIESVSNQAAYEYPLSVDQTNELYKAVGKDRLDQRLEYATGSIDENTYIFSYHGKDFSFITTLYPKTSFEIRVTRGDFKLRSIVYVSSKYAAAPPRTPYPRKFTKGFYCGTNEISEAEYNLALLSGQ